jgi:hypothetical protein
MKTCICILATSFIILGCDHLNHNKVAIAGEQPKTDTGSVPGTMLRQSSILSNNLFTKTDAEKILGEPAHLTDSAFTIKKDTTEYRSTYTANANDPKTGKTGVIYFIVEQYAFLSSAKNNYNFIKTANEKHEGVKILHDLGDEAYFHSDGENFYFILVRKADKMFRIKVNKITSTTSLDGFNAISKKITAAL